MNVLYTRPTRGADTCRQAPTCMQSPIGIWMAPHVPHPTCPYSVLSCRLRPPSVSCPPLVSCPPGSLHALLQRSRVQSTTLYAISIALCLRIPLLLRTYISSKPGHQLVPRSSIPSVPVHTVQYGTYLLCTA